MNEQQSLRWSMFFDARLLRSASEESYSPTSRMLLADINPMDFLRLAAPIVPGEKDRVKTNGIEQLLAAGAVFSELPRLEVRVDGSGSCTVVGHEGRHRAKALADRGIYSMPCLLVCVAQGSTVIHWASIDADVSAGRIRSGDVPRTIHGQNANSANTLQLDPTPGSAFIG